MYLWNAYHRAFKILFGTFQVGAERPIIGKRTRHRLDDFKKSIYRAYLNHHTVQVTSFGGAGTSMLCRFLERNGADLPQTVVPNNVEKDWAPWKHMRMPPPDQWVPDDFRAIYVVSDPRNAIVSVFRRGYQYAHVQRMDGLVEQFHPSMGLSEYLNLGIDPFQLEDHFEQWTQCDRDYPILIVKYDHLWDRIGKIVEFAGLPEHAKHDFPERRARSSNWRTLPECDRTKLDALLDNLAGRISELPPLQIR
jgi:hypothetical protein